MPDVSHWATVEPMIDPINETVWVTGDDRTRLAAYDTFEAIYWTEPSSFKMTMRGQEGAPIFVPSGRKVVETAHRYMANGLQIVPDPLFGTESEQIAAQQFLVDFLRRERFYSKFSANKRDGLMRGDWLWHLFADPERAEGARISIFAQDPSNYFPIHAEGDVDTIIGVVLAEPTLLPGNKPGIRRLTYMKQTGVGGPSPIVVSDASYKTDEWGQPDTEMLLGTPQEVFLEEEILPSPIDQIPLYHIPNAFESGFPWGSSEMRGIERLMAAINQAITDEELTLVLEGLGIYVTDAGAPVDEEGNELPWNLGPARVVEVPPNKTFTRVSGAGSIAPYQDHLAYLHKQIDEATGTNDVTRGQADVQVSESGIALALRMQPLLSRMLEKELIVTDVHMNMFFDLRNWFAAYENINMEAIRWVPRYGEKLPINKKELFDQVMTMYNATPVPLISGVEARRLLAAAGWQFSDDTTVFTDIMQEQSDFATQMADSAAPRISSEIGNLTGG